MVVVAAAAAAAAVKLLTVSLSSPVFFSFRVFLPYAGPPLSTPQAIATLLTLYSEILSRGQTFHGGHGLF